MTKQSRNTAFQPDRDDDLTALTVAVLAFTGGILGLLILGSLLVNALA
jgi:hypothetical protein